MARRSATFDEIKRKHKIKKKQCFMAVSQLLDKGLSPIHRIPQLSIIMLIFRPPSSEAFGARKSLRRNTGQRLTILLVTAYSVTKLSSQPDEIETIFNEY